jgi:hypothetical protein
VAEAAAMPGRWGRPPARASSEAAAAIFRPNRTSALCARPAEPSAGSRLDLSVCVRRSVS